jgi:hypothetical protein
VASGSGASFGRLSSFFSIDDLFTAGLGFDLAGACLLGIGLLVGPGEIFRRSGTFTGYNAANIVSLAKDRVDATAGFAAIILGFLCQGIGYAAIVWGAGAETGWRPALGAISAGLLAAALSFVVWRITRHRRLVRLLVDISFLEVEGGWRQLKPTSRSRLAQFGLALDQVMTVDEASNGEGGERLFVKRLFGIDPSKAAWEE